MPKRIQFGVTTTQRIGENEYSPGMREMLRRLRKDWHIKPARLVELVIDATTPDILELSAAGAAGRRLRRKDGRPLTGVMAFTISDAHAAIYEGWAANGYPAPEVIREGLRAFLSMPPAQLIKQCPSIVAPYAGRSYTPSKRAAVLADEDKFHEITRATLAARVGIPVEAMEEPPTTFLGDYAPQPHRPTTTTRWYPPSEIRRHRRGAPLMEALRVTSASQHRALLAELGDLDVPDDTLFEELKKRWISVREIGGVAGARNALKRLRAQLADSKIPELVESLGVHAATPQGLNAVMTASLAEKAGKSIGAVAPSPSPPKVINLVEAGKVLAEKRAEKLAERGGPAPLDTSSSATPVVIQPPPRFPSVGELPTIEQIRLAYELGEHDWDRMVRDYDAAPLRRADLLGHLRSWLANLELSTALDIDDFARNMLALIRAHREFRIDKKTVLTISDLVREIGDCREMSHQMIARCARYIDQRDRTGKFGFLYNEEPPATIKKLFVDASGVWPKHPKPAPNPPHFPPPIRMPEQSWADFEHPERTTDYHAKFGRAVAPEEAAVLARAPKGRLVVPDASVPPVKAPTLSPAQAALAALAALSKKPAPPAPLPREEEGFGGTGATQPVAEPVVAKTEAPRSAGLKMERPEPRRLDELTQSDFLAIEQIFAELDVDPSEADNRALLAVCAKLNIEPDAAALRAAFAPTPIEDEPPPDAVEALPALEIGDAKVEQDDEPSRLGGDEPPNIGELTEADWERLSNMIGASLDRVDDDTLGDMLSGEGGIGLVLDKPIPWIRQQLIDAEERAFQRE